MKWAYDLHIHTAASPCGDELMTPNNIVNMSLLKGLNIIAITDHQTAANCEAVMRVGKKKGLKVIPGIEIECMEEFHMIALFSEIAYAKEMEYWLEANMPPLHNKIDVFGHQWILNEKDEYVGEIEKMLLIAASIPASRIIEKVRKLRGIIFPAHIDRQSYSIISNLGTIPPEYSFKVIEVSRNADVECFMKECREYIVLQSSDAHYLGDISERRHFLSEAQIKELGFL